MRRTFATIAVALTLATTTVITTSASTAAGDGRPGPGSLEISTPGALSAGDQAAPSPSEVLRGARAALEGEQAGTRRPDATLALRDLFAMLPRLSSTDRAQARGILARPTQGAQDPYGDGYTVRAKQKCAKQICIHWVPTTKDAPPSNRWVDRSLKITKGVWRTEVGRLGYRPPLADGRRGGSSNFDVYLADVGAKGLYGYCAPEFTKRGYPRLASGYCVLDNDFARSQFGAKPADSLKVTAAHEFFHSVQFGYDYLEDPWMMEATATWVEERVADDVNDNRQYLPAGQLVRPYLALDTFKQNQAMQYGNWVFFEYLSQRYGTGVVRRIWQQAGSFRGDGRTYSTMAIKRVLPRRTSFPELFSQFSVENLTPARSYAEGRFWPNPDITSSGSLGRGESTNGRFSIDHMSTQTVRITPKPNLDRRSYRLRLTVDGPARATSPRVTVVRQQRSGSLERLPMALSRNGAGSTVVPFNMKQTKRVWLVLSNASTRFDCRGDDYTYSCSGTPRDEARPFVVRLKVVRGR